MSSVPLSTNGSGSHVPNDSEPDTIIGAVRAALGRDWQSVATITGRCRSAIIDTLARRTFDRLKQARCADPGDEPSRLEKGRRRVVSEKLGVLVQNEEAEVSGDGDARLYRLAEKLAPVVRIVRLPLSALTFDPAIQPRAKGIDPATVAEYREHIRAGKQFDKPFVAYELSDGTKLISQGWHRGEAHREECGPEALVDVELRPGDRVDAILDAAGSNRHGLKRTNEDKAKSVGMVLAIFPEWTDTRIAEAAGVDASMVSKARTTIECQDSRRSISKQAFTNGPTIRIGKDGRKIHVAPKAPSPPPPTPPAVPQPPPEEDDVEPLPGHSPDVGDPVATAPQQPPRPASPPDGIPRDRLGRPVPPRVLPVFSRYDDVTRSAGTLTAFVRSLRELDALPGIGGFLKTRPYLVEDAKRLASWLRLRVRPYVVCPACEGEGDAGHCPTCHGKGYVSRAEFDKLGDHLKKAANSHKPGEAWEGDTPEEVAAYKADCAALPDLPAFIPPNPGQDALGKPVPAGLRDMFAESPLPRIAAELVSLAGEVRRVSEVFKWLPADAPGKIENAACQVLDGVPFAVCQNCKGTTHLPNGLRCGECRIYGFVPKWVADDLKYHAERKGKKLTSKPELTQQPTAPRQPTQPPAVPFRCESDDRDEAA
jgi:hypothetical protein